MTVPPKHEPGVATSDGRPTDEPPKRSDGHNPPMPTVPAPRAAMFVTVALLSVWVVATVAARPLMPLILRAAEWVEVTGGFDVNDRVAGDSEKP